MRSRSGSACLLCLQIHKLMPQFCYEMTKTLSSLLATTIEKESVINHIVFWLAIFVELLQNICYFGAVQRSPREGFVNCVCFFADWFLYNSGGNFEVRPGSLPDFPVFFFNSFRQIQRFRRRNVVRHLPLCSKEKFALCQFGLPKFSAQILLRQVNNL